MEFLKALAGMCRTDVLSPDLWEFDGDKATIVLSEVSQLKNPCGAVYLSGKGLKDPILVVHGDDGQFHCFSNRCGHMGRKLDPVPGEPILRCCSVSHSTYDYQGKVVSGPAKEVIQVYQSREHDGKLTIFT